MECFSQEKYINLRLILKISNTPLMFPSIANSVEKNWPILVGQVLPDLAIKVFFFPFFLSLCHTKNKNCYNKFWQNQYNKGWRVWSYKMIYDRNESFSQSQTLTSKSLDYKVSQGTLSLTNSYELFPEKIVESFTISFHLENISGQ